MSAPDDILIEELFAQKAMDRTTFRRLSGFLQPYRRQIVLNLVLTALATVSQLAGPKLIQIGIDTHLSGLTDLGAATQGILWISTLYLLNLAAGWGLSVAQVKSAIAIGQGAMNDLRLAVFEHIQRLSLSYFDRTHQGRIISRADTDIDSMDRVLTWGASQLLSSALTLLGVVGLMLQYDWRLCLAVSTVLPPLVYATRWFHARGMDAYRKTRQQASRITSAMAENIAGVRVVQAFSREVENLARFQRIHDAYGDCALAAARVFHTYMPFVSLLNGTATAIILGYGGSLALDRQITVGELAAFILYVGMFFGPVQAMGDLYNSMLSTAASAERIFQLLDTPPQIRDRPDARPLPTLHGTVRFDHVCFRYDSTPADSWVLEDITFDAPAGSTIALVGATGSGKTSIVSLLARFYEPQQGRILIDNHPIADVTTESLHRQIAIVTQDNFLFTGTVLENLAYGRPEASRQEIVDAATRLGAHPIIERLEHGYDTRLGEKGVNLSAGERQLLCIVRAMVADPRILILDEATSAVDPHTETIIQQALDTLFAQRTCFVIAHRLSTVRHAHQILVLGGGRILERGTHDQLLAARGPYADLHAEFVRPAGTPTPDTSRNP